MSLQRSSIESVRPQTCVRRLGERTARRGISSSAADRRTEHLPVFRDFSGRLYHLAVTIKADTGKRSGNGQS